MAIRTTTLVGQMATAGLVALSGALGGCTMATDTGDEASTAEDAIEAECDRSPYNCKFPAAKKDRNRIFNYATNSYNWPIAQGTPLLDGQGNPRGNVAESSVRINYGQRKSIGGAAHVYAFAIKLDTSITASGWVKESALKHGPITRMPTESLKNPGQGDYGTIWTVTGGDNAAYGELKVIKDFDGHNGAATDYLVRPGGYINLLYNLPGSGGAATDTFKMNVPFRRAKGVPELSVKLYNPGGTHVVGTMGFVYGHIGHRYGWVARASLRTTSAPEACYVRCCDGTLQGPIAAQGAAACHEASKAVCASRGHVKRSEFNGVELYQRQGVCGTVDPAENNAEPDPGTQGESSEAPPPAAEPQPATGQCYARCCDGSLQGPIATSDPGACHEASKGACDAHGHVKRSEFNGGEVWSRPNACWAKCFKREAYHEVMGVTQDCTQHAKTYCSTNDRGGLQDAMWSQCQP